MRTTVELPDELYRRTKAEAALRGRKLKDLVEEALRRFLSETAQNKPPLAPAPSLHDAMRDCCGIIKDAPSDYASNPKYMEGFGR
jgi:hypothetical protein